MSESVLLYCTVRSVNVSWSDLTPLSGPLLEGTQLTQSNSDHSIGQQSVTSTQFSFFATQQYFYLKRNWRMLRNGTRWCISNFNVIGEKLSKTFEVSEQGGGSEHRVSDSSPTLCSGNVLFWNSISLFRQLLG